MRTDLLRVCVDANVYISAFAFGGKPSIIIDMAFARKFYLITSMMILNEVERNLITKLKFSEIEIKGFLEDILEIATMYEPTGKIQLITHEKDTLVLETAMLGNAHVLVTGDKRDLLPLKTFQEIIIESPAAFLDRMERSE